MTISFYQAHKLWLHIGDDNIEGVRVGDASLTLGENYSWQHFKKFPSNPAPANPLETLRRMVPEHNPAI